jgi:uncharacterized repeat protein (TIGR01451 family)
MRILGRSGVIVLLWLIAAAGTSDPAHAQNLQNAATGSLGGHALDPTRAIVTLTRVGTVATSAAAEINPGVVLADGPASLTYDLLPSIGSEDVGLTQLSITIPAGFTNATVTDVIVGGTPLIAECPVPGPGGYCAQVVDSLLTVDLGSGITTNLTNIRVEIDARAPSVAGSGRFSSVLANGDLTLAATPGDADGVADNTNNVVVEVVESQGIVLELDHLARKSTALVGEIVPYTVAIRNTVASDVDSVNIEVRIPPGFKYVDESARLNGGAAAATVDADGLRVPIGDVPALTDDNGNGTADPGEAGHRSLTYQLVIGAGAHPGIYVGRAIARDYCDVCVISNEAEAGVEVAVDPDFDLGTIIGKVFHDRNDDGWQDPGEDGVAGAVVALDDGSYAITDEHGRYHFPVVEPGHRLLKIDHGRTAGVSESTTDESLIIRVTPGLLAKANFGIHIRRETESIGKAETEGVAIVRETGDNAIEVYGNARMPSLVINGRAVPLPSSEVLMRQGDREDVLEINGSELEEPVRFELTLDSREETDRWTLRIHGSTGEVMRTMEGDGPLPKALSWDGRADDGYLPRPGDIGTYQLHVEFADGTRITSPRRFFGVDRTSVISFRLTGDAFESNRTQLSRAAMTSLTEAAPILREHPDERIVIEGHTDNVGSREHNLELSYGRAKAAYDFLTGEMGLPTDQFVIRGRGPDRPVASNELPDGRALNRRVEIKAELAEVENAQVRDQFRTEARVEINDSPIEIGSLGRFTARIDDISVRELTVVMSDSRGQSVETRIPIPHFEILEPAGIRMLPQDAVDTSWIRQASTGEAEPGPSPIALMTGLAGRTDPGNVVEIDGVEVPLSEDGSIETVFPLTGLRNTFTIQIRNAEGYSRIVDLIVDVTTEDEFGEKWIHSDAIPDLEIDLPPAGEPLRSAQLLLTGSTDPSNRVKANGQTIAVDEQGRLQGTVDLPHGKSRLLVEVTDPRGRTGTVEREVEVLETEIFLLAFADGTIGHMKGDGRFEAAGLDEADDFYTEGRLAYYLKGRVAGRYLITSALDTGREEFDSLFKDFGADETRRLLRNLDPDKLYPVYGDASTVVYDTETQGEFFLAVQSEDIDALLGNYALNLSDTELSAYHRTLYGGRIAYESLSRTRYGAPDSRVVLFGAEQRHVHARNELRAVGGSIYYLRHRDVIEGSEQIALVVRDKNTGLILSRDPQRRNRDYTIKYPEGRVVFRRPITSVVLDGTLVDQDLLSGNPVYIQVDYEARMGSFEKNGGGARARQQIGDHVAVGGTWIDDEQAAASYELHGVDSEIRIGEGNRLTAEYAESEGSDALTWISEDGGLTYAEASIDDAIDGSAWKVALELDVGEWFDRPDRFHLTGYYKDLEPGFASSGNLLERGTEKAGGTARVRMTEANTLALRVAHDRLKDGSASPGTPGRSSTASVQWDHRRERWEASAEYFEKRLEDSSGRSLEDIRYAAARIAANATDDLRGHLEHQQTLSGPDNDQTTLGVQYRILSTLSLDLQGTEGARGRSAQAGAILEADGSRVYVSERMLEDRTGATGAMTVLGAETRPDPSSRVYTEYQWDHSGPRDRTISLLGAQREWNVRRGFRFVTGGELSEIDAGPQNSKRASLAASAAHSGIRGVSAVSRHEIRYETGSTERVQYFTSSRLELRVTPDFTLLGSYRYSRTRDRDMALVEARLNEGSVGIAYRPVRDDRLNGMVRYTHLADRRPDLAGDAPPANRRMDVVSLEGIYEVHPRIQWSAKGATRILDEAFVAVPSVRTRTYLGIQRADFTLYDPIDLGVEYRLLHQREADDTRQGWVFELSRRFGDRLRLGAGYNFSDLSDNEFSTNDYSVRGAYVRVQGKY